MSKKSATSKTINKRIVWIASVFVILATVIFLLMQSSGTSDKSPDQPSHPVEIDPEKMAGRWLRPDGGYILEISQVSDNGLLDAAYYNPKSINVSIAKWNWTGSHLQIYIEFDDENYWGSYYNLEYFAKQDRLIGNYYQAVIRQNFDVQFIRQSNE